MQDPYLPTLAQERGQVRPSPPPPDREGLPRGDGMMPLPYHEQFQNQLNTYNRQFWDRFDEALQHSRENAYRMSLDPVVWPSLNIRAYPTAMLPGDAKPDDDEDEREISAAKRVTADVRSLTGLASLRRWLLVNGTFVGVSGAQIVYNWVPVKGKLRMRPVSWMPIEGDSLSFDYGGWPSIRVRGGSVTGPQVIAGPSSMLYRLSPEERECVIIHRFNPEAADFWRPQNSRSAIGSGLRGKLYWLWALKSQLWQMGLDWLRWFARGFTVYYYEDGNNAHLQAVQAAVKGQDGSHAMMYPVPKNRLDGSPYYAKPFEHIAVNSSNAQFIQEMLTSYLDDLITYGILHQSPARQVGPAGAQSGTEAANHRTTFDNLVKMDALQLDDTFTTDLVRLLYRTNEPDVTPGRWVSQIDSPNVEQLMESAQTIVSLGGSVPQKPLTEAAGIPEVKDGETVLGGLQPGTPSAVTGIPDGTPMVGANPSGLQPAQ